MTFPFDQALWFGLRCGSMVRVGAVLAASALGLGVAAGCSFEGAAPTSDPDGGRVEPLPDAMIPVGEFRRPLVITPPNIAAAVENVPIAIRLDSDPHLAAEVRADGSDLFVLDSTGGQLPLELEEFNSQTGSLLGWVVLPELPVLGKTIYLHYGGDAATGNERNVWEPIAQLVWHMNSVEGDVVFDSAPSAAHGTRQNGSLTRVPGVFAGALDFNDAALFVDTVEALDVERTSFSLSMWFNQREAVGELDTGFFKGGPTVTRPGYQIELGTGQWTGRVRDDDGAFNVNEEADVSFGNEAALGSTGWHHLVMVLDRGAGDGLFAYLDGIQVDSDGINGLSSLRNRNDNARAGGTNDLVRGLVDEIRLLSSAVSRDWVAVDFANSTGMVVVGDVEASDIE